MQKKDSRGPETKTAIQNAFVQLLNKGTFHRITVSDIMKEAGYSRSVFYWYYQNTWDLFYDVAKQYVSVVMAPYLELFYQLPYDWEENSLQATYKMIQITKETYPTGKVLFKSDVPCAFSNVLYEYMKHINDGTGRPCVDNFDIYHKTDIDIVVRETCFDRMLHGAENPIRMAAKYVTPDMTEKELYQLAIKILQGETVYQKYLFIDVHNVEWPE